MIYELKVRNRENKTAEKKSQLLIFSASQLLILILFVFFFSLLTSHFSSVHAANPKKELSEIERKLKERKQQVKDAIEQERSILSEVDNINKIIKKKQDELIGYEKRISETQSNIKILEDEIIALTEQLEHKKLNLKVRLKGLYKQQSIAFIL